MNETRLAKKRYRDKLKYNHQQLQKTKKTTKLQKEEYELNKRRKLLKKQTKSNKELKQNERKQRRENLVDEDNDFGRFFELASSDKVYVNGLNLLMKKK